MASTQTGPDRSAEEKAALLKELMYHPTIKDDYAPFRHLLETYSHIPPDEVEAHIYRIVSLLFPIPSLTPSILTTSKREKAWSIMKYPCIGRFSFIKLSHFSDPTMVAAIARLKDPSSSDALLDLGCCVGQTVRQLAALGVPPARLFASDLRPEFWDIGYELFRDADRMPPSTFVAGDMLDPADPNLDSLDGKVTLVHAAHFLHLFSWEQQIVAASRIVRFLDLPQGNCVVFGRQIGSVEPGAREDWRTRAYLHDETTFKKLWDEVGENTGTKWAVSVDVRWPVTMGLEEYSATRLITFVVKQVEA